MILLQIFFWCFAAAFAEEVALGLHDVVQEAGKEEGPGVANRHPH